MILHIKPPEGTKIELGSDGDVIMTMPAPPAYESLSQIIGLFDVHTHANHDKVERGFCTPPYDRVTLGLNRRGFIRISR